MIQKCLSSNSLEQHQDDSFPPENIANPTEIDSINPKTIHQESVQQNPMNLSQNVRGEISEFEFESPTKHKSSPKVNNNLTKNTLNEKPPTSDFSLAENHQSFLKDEEFLIDRDLREQQQHGKNDRTPKKKVNSGFGGWGLGSLTVTPQKGLMKTPEVGGRRSQRGTESGVKGLWDERVPAGLSAMKSPTFFLAN